MRIAYILADEGVPLFGSKGGSIHTRALVHALGQLGHQVRVVAAEVGGPVEDLPASIEPIPWKISAPPLMQAAPCDAQQAKESRKMAIAEAMADHLCQAFDRGSIDLIYERYSLWSQVGICLAKSLGVPCFLEVNAPLIAEQQRYRRIALKQRAAEIERAVFSGADAVLAVSEEVAAYVASKGAHSSRVHEVSNGVDTALFSPTVDPHPLVGGNNAFVVGFVGGLKQWHGLDVLLEAFKRLSGTVERAHLLIVGDGKMRPWIEGFIQGAGLGGRVTLTGSIGHADLPTMLRRMNVATLPYPQLEDFYFSPLKLFEYMASGCPVVASNIGQVGRMLDHGRNGLLVPPGDPIALENALQRIHDDRALAKNLSRDAVRTVSGRTWRANALKVLDLAARLQEAA